MVKTKNRIGIGQRPCEFYPSKEKGGPYPPQRGSPRKAVGTPRNQKRAETGKPEKKCAFSFATTLPRLGALRGCEVCWRGRDLRSTSFAHKPYQVQKIETRMMERRRRSSKNYLRPVQIASLETIRLRAEGFEVDDDNEPSPESVPTGLVERHNKMSGVEHEAWNSRTVRLRWKEGHWFVDRKLADDFKGNIPSRTFSRSSQLNTSKRYCLRSRTKYPWEGKFLGVNF